MKLAGDNPLVAWVDRDDLNSKRKKSGEAVDDRHDTAEEYEWLGRPFSRQAKAPIEGRESARDGRS